MRIGVELRHQVPRLVVAELPQAAVRVLHRHLLAELVPRVPGDIRPLAGHGHHVGHREAWAVDGEMLKLLAIARADSVCSKCSLRNSLNFRMDSLSAGT